jgi:predicted alpha/beta superfamily hydrolase
MFKAGQQLLLVNMSGHTCFEEGRQFSPGSRIEVLLADTFDPFAKASEGLRGPWGIGGWNFEQLKAVASAVRDPITQEVFWHREGSTELWKDYSEFHDERHHTVVGTVKVLPNVWSTQLGNRRDILVYLPPSYNKGSQSYPVIYMHDGQNLFDDVTSFGAEWAVDETLEAASTSGLEAIVVGIPNMGTKRTDEYSPFVDAKHGGGKGAAYMRFIVETLKPRIDKDYRTLSDRANTGIFGSSMGGLISLYGFFHHSNTFGFAGIMSPSLWFAKRAIFTDIEKMAAVSGKLYMDIGTQEGQQTLDDVRRMYRLLLSKGYSPGDEICYVEEQGGAHTETAWSGRLREALHFLLGVERRRIRRSKFDQPAEHGKPQLVIARS